MSNELVRSQSSAPSVTIRAGILKALFAGVRSPGVYYGAACGCSARAVAAGTTLEALKASGLALQCASHHDYMGTTGLPVNGGPTLDARRKAYREQHAGVSGSPVITMETSPTGIRPAVVPGAWNKAATAAWYEGFRLQVANAADTDMLTVPAPGTIPAGGAPEGKSPNSAPGSAVTGPKEYRAWVFRTGVLAETFQKLNELLGAADDVTRADAIAKEMNAWAFQIPESMRSVDAGLWDGKIRQGAKVTLVGESAHARARTLGGVLHMDGGGYMVAHRDDVTAMLKVEIPGRKLPLAVKETEVARWRPAPPPVAAAEGAPKFGIGDCVAHEELGEGEVTRLDASKKIVTAYFASVDGEMDVPEGELSKIG